MANERKFLSNGIDLDSKKIIHLADGSATDDAATWGQVQAFLAGLAWKPAVRVASTGDVTIAGPGASIDGVALSNGDRVLLKSQATASQNGIYVFNGAASAMTRATDMDTAAECKSATVLVAEGTVNHDTAWTQTAEVVTLGTDTITFVAFGGGVTYTADGTGGLQLVGTAFSVLLPASSGLTKDGTGLYVDRAIVMTRYAADIGDGASTSIAIVHNKGTKDVHVGFRQNSDDAEVDTYVVHTSTSTVTATFATAPAAAALRAVVIG